MLFWVVINYVFIFIFFIYVEIYEDKDNARNDEVVTLGEIATGINVFSALINYAQFKPLVIIFFMVPILLFCCLVHFFFLLFGGLL